MGHVMSVSPYLGCDPELFFEHSGKVIGSEKVLDPAGLIYAAAQGSPAGGSYNGGRLVLDGVQAELNPNAYQCRAYLGNEISLAFRSLRQHLAGKAGVSVSFNGVVEIDKEELASLSEKSRTLGCAPSLNVYDSKASIKVNPKTYQTRSAGGHIHLGLTNIVSVDGPMWKRRQDLVPILDAILGNTCVMLDRDPLAAERRKVYGRAGEHRLPPHGLEYRTLSNFWLRSYQLMSFVMGVSRLCTSIWYTALTNEPKFEIYGMQPAFNPMKALLGKLDMEKVARAINTNDLTLAKENWAIVRAFIQEHVSNRDAGLDQGKLENFDYFLTKVEEGGLEYWFPLDPMTHWCNLKEGHQIGWESFLADRVSVVRRGIPSVWSDQQPPYLTSVAA